MKKRILPQHRVDYVLPEKPNQTRPIPPPKIVKTAKKSSKEVGNGKLLMTKKRNLRQKKKT